MTTETTDFADFTEIFSFCPSLCRWICCCFLLFVLFCVLFSLFVFFLLLSVSYLVQAVVFAVFALFCFLFFLCLFFVLLCFLVVSLAPLSQSSSYILFKLLLLTKNQRFYFLGVEYHCLASLARFFLFLFRLFNQNPCRSVAIRFLSIHGTKLAAFS